MSIAYRPDLMGQILLSDQNTEFEAGSIASFTLVYTCGKFGIDDLGMLMVVFRSANDQTALQLDDPKALGFITAEASNGSTLDVRYDPRGYIRPWYKALIIRAKQFLREGDTITIRIGDKRQGSPGLRLQTFCEDQFEFRTMVDPIATGIFTPVLDAPKISLVPGPAKEWKIVIPSQCKLGEQFQVAVFPEDKWGNPTSNAEETFTIESTSSVKGIPKRVEFGQGNFSHVFRGLQALECGDTIINLINSTAGTIVSTSNPMRVTENLVQSRYWSDLHGQTEETIGTNSAHNYFLFARDRAFLDICAHQANDFQITDNFWDKLNSITAEFNETGRFITLPGYEWSGNTGVGGDHNVWFRDEGRPIFRSSRALVEDRTSPNTDCHTATDLFNALRDENAIVTSHCGGRYADVKYAHDAKSEPSVEIHSCWGTFEWIVRDAFEANYRVGIVAASDDHKGRPGASHPGASKFGAYGGYTCHLMSELSRDALFNSFRRRHHYATSGARIWLDILAEFAHPATLFHTNPDIGDSTSETVNEAVMGDILAVEDDEFTFNFDIVGTAPIERVELRDGLDTLEVIRPYALNELGSRIRIVWEGAENRGRGRNAIWDGTANIVGNNIARFEAINFWNAERPPRLEAGNSLAWSSFTTGSFSAIDIWLENRDDGHLSFSTSSLQIEIAIDKIGFEDTVFEAGGLEKRIRLYRLPEENPYQNLKINRTIKVRSNGDTRPFICVTQEDGYRAWSSPLYIFKKGQ